MKDLPIIENASPNSLSLQWWHLVALIVILLIAATARYAGLTRHGLQLDEAWTIEVATGRGSAHLNLPVNQLMPAPDLFDLNTAPPWWCVWSHVEIIQPPLYWIFLRWWEDVFGDTDRSGRMFSLVTSMVAVVLLFDVARLMNGAITGLWAATLMAVANVQVDYGRLTRNYALLTVFALAMAAAIIRIEKIGFSRRRWIGLFLATLATLLTHYFCVGVIIALMMYCGIRFEGRLRLLLLAAFVAAGIVFTLVWAPFMWQQRNLFSTTDPATLFLTADLPGHVWNTIERMLLVPSNMLWPVVDRQKFIALGAAVLYLLPFALFRRRPDLLLWGLWLIGSVAVVTGLDLARQTTHLFYPRYTILAGPAVYVLLPGMFSKIAKARWLQHLIPAVAVVGCALAVPDLQVTAKSDALEVVHDLTNRVSKDDLLIFLAKPSHVFEAQSRYMMMDQCLHPLRCKIVLLTGPPDARVRECVARSNHVYAVMDDVEWHSFLPAEHPFDGRVYPGWGLRMRLK